MIKNIIIYFIFSFMSMNSVYAVNQHWEFSGWYGGGCYPNLEFDLNVKDRVYLVSDVAGIWRSDDLGENWHIKNNGLKNINVASIAIARSDSNVIYAGTKKGLFISRNAGESWTQCEDKKDIIFSRPESYRAIAVCPTKPNFVYIGTSKGAVYYSEDHGSRFKVLGEKELPFNCKIVITALQLTLDGNSLLVASDKGIARYSMPEKKWETQFLTYNNVNDLALSPMDDNIIYFVSGNKFFVFNQESNDLKELLESRKGKITRIAVCSAPEGKPDFIALTWENGWNGGISLSKDGGETWDNSPKKMIYDGQRNPTRSWVISGGRATSIKMNPFNDSVLFMTDWWGVYRSDDRGETWVEKINGAPNTVGSDICFDPAGNIYVATMDNGVIKSIDGGKNYKALIPSITYDKNICGHIWRILISDNRIFCTSSPWNVDINQVLVSNDFGNTFTVSKNGLPGIKPRVNTMWGKGYPRAFAISPDNPDLIYLGIDGDDGGGLFISKDGGKYWKRAVSQPGSLRIYNALSVDPTDSKRILWGGCGKNGGIYLSEDKGVSWSKVFSKMSWVFDAMISGDGVMYIAGDNNGPELYASDDHGRNWKLMKKFAGKGAADAICLNPKDRNMIAVSSTLWSDYAGGKIYLSSDRGKKWKDITGDLPNGKGAAAMAFSPDGKYLYMNRYAGSVYRLKLNEQ